MRRPSVNETRHSAACNPQRLLQLMRDGQIAALDQVSKCYGEHMFHVAQAQCGTEDRARDAVQDVMLTAGQSLQKFRGEGSVKGWLLRMVINACHHTRRGRKNDPNWHAPIEAAEGYAGDSNPEQDMQRQQLRSQLQQAMDTLSPGDRTLLLLADTQGWTGPELAAEAGLTPATVRARLSRARRALRGVLGETWRELDPD